MELYTFQILIFITKEGDEYYTSRKKSILTLTFRTIVNKTFIDQKWHLVILLLLLCILYWIINNESSYLAGDLWGIRTYYWLILAVLSPILHQLYVLICWRSELHHQYISNTFGENGFKFYKIGFAILILSRPILLTILAISNTMSIVISPIVLYPMIIIFTLPSVYLFYSVVRYFGIDRAFGKDHFYPDQAKNEPFVNQGIFKYTKNGMYKYGFLILYLPGLMYLSKTALLIALFNHIYIWVHYYFVELPDIKIIYD